MYEQRQFMNNEVHGPNANFKCADFGLGRPSLLLLNFFVEMVFQVLTVLELKNFRFDRRLLNNFKRIN